MLSSPLAISAVHEASQSKCTLQFQTSETGRQQLRNPFGPGEAAASWVEIPGYISNVMNLKVFNMLRCYA